MRTRSVLSGAMLLAMLSVGLVSVSAQMVSPSYLRKQQYRQQQQLQQQQRQQARSGQPTEIKGTLVGATRSVLQVLDDKRQTWRVGAVPATQVHVTGNVDARALRNGTVVEFQAEIDPEGAIANKVGALSIVSLSQDKRLGLYPSGNNATDFHSPSAKKASAPHGAKTAKHGAPAPGSYRIVGQLNFNRNKLTVHADRYHLPLELTDQPTITVDSSDFTMASRGDKVVAKGMLVPNRIGQMYASEITIELGNASTGNQKGFSNPPAKKSAATPGNPF